MTLEQRRCRCTPLMAWGEVSHIALIVTCIQRSCLRVATGQSRLQGAGGEEPIGIISAPLLSHASAAVGKPSSGCPGPWGTDPGNQQKAGTPGLCGPGKELPTTLSARKTRQHVLSGAPVWGPCRLPADAVKPQWRCQPLQWPDSLVTAPPWGPTTTDLLSEPGAGYSCSRLLEISIRITSLLPARGRGRARPQGQGGSDQSDQDYK